MKRLRTFLDAADRRVYVVHFFFVASLNHESLPKIGLATPIGLRHDWLGNILWLLAFCSKHMLHNNLLYYLQAETALS